MANKIKKQMTDSERQRHINAAKFHSDFLNRENKTVDGFSFDQDTFENLIDFYTPMEDIPIILNVTIGRLDEFCKSVYNGIGYKDVYDYLSRRSQFYTRRAFTNLAYSGNAAAIKVASESFMKLLEPESKDQKVVIMGAIPVTNKGNGSK